jgi:hypothetical protein
MEQYEYIKYAKKINKIFHEKRCLFYEQTSCTEKIVQSHTIQRKRALEKIAKDGHVYGFIKDLNIDAMQLELEVSKVSINIASTFNGFCSYHDNLLFHCLDDFEFSPTDNQAFMITYRTLIRELYTKSASEKSGPIVDEMIDSGPDSICKLEIEDTNKNYQLGTKLGNDFALKESFRLFQLIKQNNFLGIRYFVIKLKNIPQVMTSGAFMPEFDYEGGIINDYQNNDDINWLSLNIFADTDDGIISLTWFDNSKIEQFVCSLLSQEDYLNKIVEIAFTHIENTFFSKSWWDSLKVIKKSRITKMVSDYRHYDLDTGLYTGIRKNNLHYLDLELKEIKTNCNRIKNLTNASTPTFVLS